MTWYDFRFSKRHLKATGNPNLRYCIKCKKPKSISEFYVNRRASGGYDVWCKPCMRAYKLASYHKHKQTK